MSQTTEWQKAQVFEKDWWASCVNTFSEEQKQLVYAEKMGLHAEWDYGHFPTYDLKGTSVLDIGGGPVSILLKCKNFKRADIVDPLPIPDWCRLRYEIAHIAFRQAQGEKLPKELFYLAPFDNVLIYNVLQHTENPRKVIENARKLSKIIRLFEWVEVPKDEGHLHVLHQSELDLWLGGEGKVETINDRGCVGTCYFGVFLGDHYEKKV